MSFKLISLEEGKALIESDLVDGNNWSQAIEELQSPAAKQFVIREATKQGIPGAAVGMGGGTFPVDESGRAIEPKEGPSDIAAYRVEIPVTSTFR